MKGVKNLLEQKIKQLWELDADQYDAHIKNALDDDRNLTNAWFLTRRKQMISTGK